MKLTITIDAPEKEIRECVEGIPAHFFDPRFINPIRMVARALREAGTGPAWGTKQSLRCMHLAEHGGMVVGVLVFSPICATTEPELTSIRR